jgi:Tol biopolymer transport system component
MALGVGQILQGRYRIEALLGQGGMGAVYRATDLRFSTPVAIKENLEPTEEAQRQFSREAALLHQLRHPNLPRVSDYFVIPDQGQYLVMDYIAGEDLNQVLLRHRRVPQAQAIAWVQQVLDALDYLHSQNIIHRDVKPANVKITPDGRVFLVDFGLAKVFDPVQRTTIGARAVTPGFAPPEQYGQGRTDARSDLYSVGATLYALLTGQVPADALEFVIGQKELVPPRQLNPEISTEVEAAILRAMQVRPTDRLQSVADMRAALVDPPTRWLPGRESGAGGPGALAAGGSSATSGRARSARRAAALPGWLWLLVGATAALLVGAVIVAWVGVGSAQDDEQANLPPPAPSATSVVAVATSTPLGPATVAATTQQVPAATQAITPTRSLKATSSTSEDSAQPPPSLTLPVPTETPLPPADTPLPPTNTPLPPTNTPPPPTATRPPPTDTPAPPTPVPPPTQPPSRGRIAFISDRDGSRQIYIMNADGSGLARRTFGGQEERFPFLSPDGRLLAFSRKLGDNWDIFVMNADGSGERNLTNHPAFDRNPTWAPDSRRLAFVSERDGNQEVYAINVDGSGLANLTNHPADDRSPGWSRDGRIAFSSKRNGELDIYVMNVDGSGVARLTNLPQTTDSLSQWSPDASRIVFMSERDGNKEIYVMNADGGGQTNLTRHGDPDQDPCWSPDGREIVFSSGRSGKAEVYVMNSDGSGPRNLTQHPAYDGQPSWSP